MKYRAERRGNKQESDTARPKAKIQPKLGVILSVVFNGWTVELRRDLVFMCGAERRVENRVVENEPPVRSFTDQIVHGAVF